MSEWVATASRYLDTPLVSQFGTAVIAIIVGLVIIRLLQTVAARSIAETGMRYRIESSSALPGTLFLLLSCFPCSAAS